MTAESDVRVDQTTDPTARDAAADASADGAIVSEVSIASASAAEARHQQQQPRATNGRFVRPAQPGHEPADDGLPADRFLDRELSWLQFNERVLELAEDEHAAAARAGPLPGDLRQQPRRVLHGPGRRAQAPHRRRRRRARGVAG